MRNYKNLSVIGTSHIAKESILEVKHKILEIKPDIVALELDAIRFHALLYNKKSRGNLKDLNEIGFKGFLFNLIGGYIQKKLGEIVNVKPGSEMKQAIASAKEVKADIALIDQDVRITLKNLSKSFPLKEKLMFLAEIIKSIFTRKKISIDLTKVPDKKLVKKLTAKLKDDYPSLYKSLIDDRNKVMAENLYNLMQSNKNIIAIVGIGHEDEVIEIIKKR